MKETPNNLTKAFLGESQARNRYTYYAKVAQKEGYEQIAAIFLETAEQEKIHAKRIFEHIHELQQEAGQPGQDIVVEVPAPTVYSTTLENLRAAIAGENHEHQSMYPEYAQIAETEGYTKIANRLKAIAKAEQHHAQRYGKLLEQLEKGTIFKKDQEVTWVCRECGYVHTGLQAPEKCPSCDHPRAFYQVQCENY